MDFNLRAFLTGRLMDSERAFWNAVVVCCRRLKCGPVIRVTAQKIVQWTFLWSLLTLVKPRAGEPFYYKKEI